MLCSLLCFTGQPLPAQNLVVNGDFETLVQCPTLGRIRDAVGWSDPNTATSDFFHSCVGGGDWTNPQNVCGIQAPRSGQGYGGAWVKDRIYNYREYLQGSLSQPLTAGKTYRFRVYISRSDKYDGIAGTIGIYFSDSLTNLPNDVPIIRQPQIQTMTRYTDKQNWVEMSGTFMATGGERFFIIGDFDTQSAFVSTGSPNALGAYYYFDDASLIDCATLFPATALGNDTSFCGNTFSYRLEPTFQGDEYLWSNRSPDPFITATRPGVYWLRIGTDHCYFYDSITLGSVPGPALNLGNDTALCIYDTTMLWSNVQADRYLWSTGDTLNHTRVSSTPDFYMLTIWQGPCITADTIYIEPKALPVIHLPADRSLCAGDSLLLDAGNMAASYLWENGTTTQLHKVPAPGTYRVIITNNLGCVASDSIVLSLLPAPVVNLGRDTAICEGASVTLDAGAGYKNYQWSNGAVSSFIHATHTGSYFVRVKDTNGCTGSDTFNLKIKPAPAIGLPALIPVCQPNLQLDAGSGFIAYRWNDGSALQTLHVSSYGTFWVQVTDTAFCSSTAFIDVQNNCPAIVYVPDALTPNKDQLNESFIPSYLNVSAAELSIYDRWGKLLFYTTDQRQSWDGLINGADAPTDTYVYKLNYTGMDGKAGSRSGTLTLIR